MNKMLFSVLFVTIGLFQTFTGQSEEMVNTKKTNILNKDSIIEAKLLSQTDSNNLIKRVGDTLFLKFENGKICNFINSRTPIINENKNGKKTILTFNTKNGKKDTVFKVVYYRLLNIMGNEKFYLIKKQTESKVFYPTYIYLLINKTNGCSIEISSPPVFSPDNNRFASTHGWEPGDGNILGITITNTSNNLFRNEFYVIDKKNVGYDTVYWVSGTEIRATRSNKKSGKLISSLKYKWNGTKWILAK